MTILITNDDGVNAEGINQLYETLSKEHKVYVLAPDRNRSAVSNCFSLFGSPLSVKKVKENFYSCSGTPVDCVITGLTGNLFSEKIDVLVSGINKGGNLGRDIVYSGTCAAARQATYYEVPAIAVSVEPESWEEAEKNGLKYKAIAEFVLKNLKTLASLCEFKKLSSFVNINGASVDSYKGWKYASELAVRDYHDRVDLIPDEGGDSNTFKTDFHDGRVKEEYDLNTDSKICADGYISVSKVFSDPAACKVDGLNLSL